MRSSKRIVTAMGVTTIAVASASAQVNWVADGGGHVGPSGNGSFFSWANGHNSNSNLFGSPLLQGGTQFVFLPSSFTAQASNGGQDTKTDQIDVDLHAFAGYKFTEIKIQVLGDYSISGPGSVSASGTMSLNELFSPNRTTSDPMLPGISFTSGSGQWSSTADRDLSLSEGGIPFTDIHITFSHSIVAISGAGGSSVIATLAAGLPVAITIIPEPGVIALLGVAGLVAARRRR